jgi:hypothetical protein
MVHHVPTGRSRSAGVLVPTVAVSLMLAGCSETVWVKQGATAGESEAAVEQCLSAAYLRAPAAPATRTLGSDVAAPSFTTCSGLGFSGACVTSRGQYTRPLTIRYDANASARSQIFRQCMQYAGWSEQSRRGSAPALAAEDDWTKGFDVGARDGASARCAPPPIDVTDPQAWSLGCQSGQRAR